MLPRIIVVPPIWTSGCFKDTGSPGPEPRSLVPARSVADRERFRAGRLQVLVGAVALVAAGLLVVAVTAAGRPRVGAATAATTTATTTTGRPELEMRA
jgi:hypothetical protein